MDTGTGEKPRTLTRRELVRRSALFGGAVVVAPIIAACQPGATPGASTSPGASGSTAAQKVTIRVWGYGLDDARAPGPSPSLSSLPECPHRFRST